MNELINELYKQLDAKDKIINTQVLEIARLKEEIEHLENQLLNVKQQFQIALDINTQKQQRIDKTIELNQYIIDYGFDYDGFNDVENLKGLIDMLVDYAEQVKQILGDKENE